MIIGDDAVSAMYEYICNNLSKIGVKKGNVFKYKRPKKLDSDSYIVINHLPFVHESEIENGMINVNVHVRRTASDEPNTKNSQRKQKQFLLCLKTAHILAVHILTVIPTRCLQKTTITHTISI